MSIKMTPYRVIYLYAVEDGFASIQVELNGKSITQSDIRGIPSLKEFYKFTERIVFEDIKDIINYNMTIL